MYLSAAAFQHPSMLERQYLGRNLEIGVIVEQRHVMGIGKGGDQEIGHADGTMAISAGQSPLCVQSGLPVFVVGWQIFVR